MLAIEASGGGMDSRGIGAVKRESYREHGKSTNMVNP